MSEEFINLETYLPTLDPRSEETLAQQSQLVVSNRSGGVLNDFSDHSPITALLQGFAFAGAELLWYVNKLPLALLLKFLATASGVSQSLGSRSVVDLTFTLSAPLTTPFQIPSGFEVTNGELSFFTDQALTIPAGASFGVVQASAGAVGSSYNLPAYTINRATQPLAFLASVVNIEPAGGGLDAETPQRAIDKALLVLRTSNLVSEFDFNEATERILGEGSRVKTIGLLGADKVSTQNGAVHVFALDSSGNPINSAQTTQISQALTPRLMLGTQLLISPMNLVPISASMIVQLEPQVNVNEVATDLWRSFQEYLAPSAFNPGASVLVDELKFYLRPVNGLKYIELLEINGASDRIPMPNEFSLPKAESINLNLVDSNGNIFQIGFGDIDEL